VKELMKHLKVDSYGKCLHNKDEIDPVTGQVLKFDAITQQQGVHSLRERNARLYRLASSYPFYLSLENAREPGYITEKLWQAYRIGSLPIYYGAPDATLYTPPNSFVDVTSFPTVGALAQHLNYLRSNRTAYLEYFAWKHDAITPQFRQLQYWSSWDGDDRTPPSRGRLMCRLCAKVAQMKKERAASAKSNTGSSGSSSGSNVKKPSSSRK
jgi:hypothetical protein